MTVFHKNIIGIIADSHGRSDMIQKSVEFLLDQQCDLIIHLGDICDSFSPATCDPCLNILMDYHVVALKGNNDHVLELNQSFIENPNISKKGLTYLHQLAPVLECEKAVFAHSLPFFKELGISCITRFMGDPEIRHFCSEGTHRILFRGHGHDPELIWIEKNTIQRADLKTDTTIHLEKYRPCIITCGALTRGLAMIWDKRNNTLKNLSFL